jgi:hypothetical protein
MDAREANGGGPERVKAVLTSWKDIAQYLGKGIRTVQRWEDDLGLPVRRTKDGVKSSVLAVPAEIDAWVRSLKFEAAEREALIQSLRDEIRRLRHELALAQLRISRLSKGQY